MKDHFYLVELENSPFSLSVPEALHLGATATLNVYTLVTEEVQMARKGTNKQLNQSHFYLGIPFLQLAAMEKTYIQGVAGGSEIKDVLRRLHPLQEGWVDERCFGAIPIATLFEGESPIQVRLKPIQNMIDTQGPIEASIGDLLCFTEDLEKLVKQGQIRCNEQGRVSSEDSAAVTASADATDEVYPKKKRTYLQLIRCLLAQAEIDTTHPHKTAEVIQAAAARKSLEVPYKKDTIANVINELKSELK